MHVWYTCTGPAFICVIAKFQPSVLSVVLATDQRSSNGCYNCTRQAVPYQPAVKMNLQHADTLLRGCFLCWYTTLHKYFCCKFYLSIQLNFLHMIQKKFVLWSNTLSQSFQWYRLFSIPCHTSLHFFSKVGIFMRIICYYQIRPRVVWKVHGTLIDGYDSQNKDKNITITKKTVC